MTTTETEYELAERVFDATQDAQKAVLGMATVAVVTVLNGTITTDLFGDYDSAANLSAAHYYANTCRRLDGAVCYVIGADILDGSD